MEKFKSFMKKLKKNIVIYLVVWLIIAILLVAPITYTITQGLAQGLTWLEACIYNLANNVMKFPITEVFKAEYFKDFLTGIEVYSIIYFSIIVYSIVKTLPKGGFHDIEHGSSDWCEPGEQYKVLSKKEGILLAKDNYLPLTKPGNHNVLIVGRIWCW